MAIMVKARDVLALADQERLLKEFYTTRDRSIRDTLVLHNHKLAISWARKHALYSKHGEDMEQAAVIGLIRAIEGFDPSRGIKFSTYASIWVRNEIQEAIRKTANIILGDELNARVNHEMKYDDNPSEAIRTLASLRSSRSLERMPYTIFGSVDDESDSISSDTSFKSTLSPLLKHLTPEERLVVSMRSSGMIFKDIGAQMQITGEMVRRKYDGAITKMRKMVDYMGTENPLD
jgi:RNA polymerase sigma factor (sigma-70 family)